MIQFFSTSLLFLILLSAPVVTFAAPVYFSDLVYLFVDLINMAIYIAIGLAVLGFFWGLSKYILQAHDSTKIEDGKKVMTYGLLGVFVVVSIWGILRILVYTFL